MALPEPPSEIILKILNLNLSPRDGRTRLNSLATYCLLNKSMRDLFQPLFLVHLSFHGDSERFWKLLRKFRVLIFAGKPGAPKEVKSVTCTLELLPVEERKVATQMFCQIVERCPRLEELAVAHLDGMSIRWTSTALYLRALHLCYCIMERSEVYIHGPVRHVALSHSNIKIKHESRFTPLELYYAMDENQVNFSVFDYPYPHALYSLRIKYTALLCQEQWAGLRISRLELIENKSLERLESLIKQVQILHAAVSPADLRFLSSLVSRGDSPLQKLRLARNGEPEWQVATSEEWDTAWIALEEICKSNQVKLDFEWKTDAGVVRFWEECSSKEFFLQGFE